MTNLSEKYWGRAGHIEIEGVNVPTDGLDFKFDIEKIGSFYNKWKASILGLSLNTINKISVWNPQVAYSERRNIKIFAGYEGIIGQKLICNGTITNAIPSSPPEMWLNMSGLLYIGDNRIISNSYKIRNKTKKEIFEEMCKKIGRPFRYELADDDIRGFQFTMEGMYGSLPVKYAQQFDVIVYLDNDTLVATTKNAQFKKPDKKQRINTIDIDHGLISIPQVSIKGAVIRTRMNDTYNINDWIDLKSKMIPSANGLYIIIKKHHVGHLRGDDWYTELTTIRKAF